MNHPRAALPEVSPEDEILAEHVHGSDVLIAVGAGTHVRIGKRTWVWARSTAYGIALL